MREGWELKKWKDVLEIRSGRNQKEVEDPNGEYPILGSAGKVMAYANNYLCEEGTTIIGRKGTINNPMFIKTKFWNVDTAFGLHALGGLDKYYLFYFCQSFDFTELDKGSGRPSLVKTDLLKIGMPIPSLQEQQQIVAILDEAFEAIDQAKANIEKNIENAKELFQSKLNAVFSQKGKGSKNENLEDVFTFRQGIQRGVKLQSENKLNGQVRFVRIIDYTQGSELPRYIDNPGQHYILNETDISLVRYGATTGFVCRGISGALANNLFRVIPKDKFSINSDYLYYFLASPVFQRYIKSKMSGAAMPAISFGMISKISFPITSIQEQEKLAIKVSSLEMKTKKVITSYHSKLKYLEELKKSILQKAFAGELTQKELAV